MWICKCWDNNKHIEAENYSSELNNRNECWFQNGFAIKLEKDAEYKHSIQTTLVLTPHSQSKKNIEEISNPFYILRT
ncbi:hypothetical protein JTB14_009417 [Gonioctena quinquepunctata]|nr:hypothetical protein JTB14_009417 [Gonioctena quinquepunctata]